MINVQKFWSRAFAALVPFLGAQLWAQQMDSFTYQGPAYIPDASSEIRIVLPVFVGKAFSISNVTVTVNISHPDIGDLEIDLINPFGRTRELAHTNCEGTHDLTNFTFDSHAAQTFGNTCPSAAGQTLRPVEDISDWGGDGTFGYWLLAIKDEHSGNVGFLLDYTLTITGSTTGTKPIFDVTSIVDAASGLRGPVTPGESVWIYGINLGPSPLVQAQLDANGKLPTTLGGTTVAFDGVPAPIFLADQFGVQVQVPNEVSGKGSTNVVVSFQGVSSATVPVGVVVASPGIHTSDGGTGQILASNQDGTQNGLLHPAPKGSIISIYANGLGLTNPQIPTGQAAPSNPLSTAIATIEASVGGALAPITFAGAAPGFVGLFQVNVQVPAAAPSGNNIPLSLTVNGTGSQRGATIVVQ